MINYWWVTRPKRKLNSIPDILTIFADISLGQQWEGQRSTHLSLEEELEANGIKRVGERRDASGSGARTYRAWVQSLGLLFVSQETKQMYLTLAGEAILNGDPPVQILKEQVLKYQFPSPFSISRGVDVNRRFKIRPFRFLLRLLTDDRIMYLSGEEIAKVVIVQAENESDACYEDVVQKIINFRSFGDNSLEDDFIEKYCPHRSDTNLIDFAYRNLLDVANTMINWLDYTQLIFRDEGKIAILPEAKDEVDRILNDNSKMLTNWEQAENFQRKYGCDPKHSKDTRNLLNTKTITASVIAENKIKNAFIKHSLTKPISEITSEVIDVIAEESGFAVGTVSDVLNKLYPHGAIQSFMAEYFEMAFRGRDDATEFEKATNTIFHDVFHFESHHVGPIGLTPDVLILSDKAGYQALIDNKAYSKYSITNDHHNRMVHNYIGNISNYSESNLPIGFFTYIAGGFTPRIDSQIKGIYDETGVSGSVITVSTFIKMIERQQKEPYSHQSIRDIFSQNKQVDISMIGC